MSPLLAGGHPSPSCRPAPMRVHSRALTPDPSSVDFLARAPSEGNTGLMTTLALPPCRVQVLSPHFSPQGAPPSPFWGSLS